MSARDEVPTTEEIRSRADSYDGCPTELFDRWLAEHDQQVAADVLEQLEAEKRSFQAQAWQDGHSIGWEHARDGNYGNDWWDDPTPNPYRSDLKNATKRAEGRTGRAGMLDAASIARGGE